MPTGDLMVLTAEKKESRTGQPYYDLRVRKPNDAEGPKDFNAKLWSNAMRGDMIPEVGKVMACYYKEDEFNGVPQLIIEKYENRATFDPEQFKAKPVVNRQEVLDKIFRRKWVDPGINEFMGNLEDYLFRPHSAFGTDRSLDRFFEVPGGAKNHHTGRGGLLQHINEMWDIAEILLDDQRWMAHFPGMVNREILLVSIVLHDLGKIHEYDPETRQFQETYVGAFMGHLSFGASLVHQLWPPTTSDEVGLRIIHSVLSHHGGPSTGSPISPRTPEAQVLHVIDLLSARMDVMRTAEIDSLEGRNPVYNRPIGAVPITKSFPPRPTN